MTRSLQTAARRLALLALLGAPVAATRADYRDDVGFTRLQAELEMALPTGNGVSVTQAEAHESTNNFLPDANNAEFAGKTITPKSAGGASGHATIVGAYFYGLTSSMAPGIDAIDAYDANQWIGMGFLRTGLMSFPRVENRAVQNHSWVANANFANPENVADYVEILQRFDFAIERDDFVAVVGLNNGSGSSVPTLLGSSYNAISVGLTNGEHSTGATALDTPGRVKPEIVAPFGVTSFATPSVGAAAALLIAQAQSSGFTDAARSVTVKAILLAGATKGEFANWNRTATRPLDAHFGAGQLNVYRSYHVLAAGRQAASASTLLNPRGWDYAQTVAGARRYFFEVAPGNTAPGFSALLTWNRSPSTSWTEGTANLANLSLKLYAATGFTPGALLDESVSEIDNLEHLYLPALPPGRYALEVTADQSDVNYGLAWHSHSTVTLAATTPAAGEFGAVPGGFNVTRAGDTAGPLTVRYTVSGSATNGADFTTLSGTVTLPVGAASAPIAVSPLADALAEGDETVTVTLASDFAYSVGAASVASVTIHDRPIDAWRFAHFTTAELADPEIGGDLADPEGDGIVNRVEYALARAPKEPDAPALPAVGISASGYLTLTYTRPLSAVDVSYLVEVSGSLAGWESGAGHTVIAGTSSTAATETVTVRSATAASALPQQFIRLRIERQ